eukprot:symbB.v1.2.024938.t2/scaffold2396.1/size80221/4
MAVVSDDHADESLNMQSPTILSSVKRQPRLITAAEVQEHNGRDLDGTFWAVVDGWVVDATAFLKTHPGGLKKLLQIDDASIGASGKPFGFSFSKGRNAHFPETGRRFKEGVQRYLQGAQEDGSKVSGDDFLHAVEVSDLVDAVFQHRGLRAPSQELQRLMFARFDQEYTGQLSAQDCLCLVDALFRVCA